MKIIAVGMNYSEHNKEMKNPFLPKEPVIFMKPDSALLKDGNPFFIPDFSRNIQYEAELVVKISRLGKNITEKFARRYYDEITIGIDFTARDLQHKLREEGYPWEICKGFDHSAAIGDFISIEKFDDVQNIDFSLKKNGETVQKDNSRNMIFGIDVIIAYISRFFTLKIGDLIFTGTPAGVGNVDPNDRLEGSVQDKKLLDFKIK
ncbi:MAG: fumarylacetoacetate hydrolase family protein [Candidatus Azobacteroides sp.]|nr:fumarylacetoacetate hydrolase family protein [Candidatus Azobacteroides sp.]